MTEPEPPQRGVEYPPLEKLPPAVDPYATVDYPANYPDAHGYSPGHAGLPPPVYSAPYPPGVGYPPPYSGQFADPYDPYRPPVPSGTSGKAIGALVAAVVGVPACVCFVPSLVGIVLGFIAIGETKNTGQAGHGLAVAAVVVGIATLALGGIFMVLSIIGA
jgi:hypothetical protein